MKSMISKTPQLSGPESPNSSMKNIKQAQLDEVQDNMMKRLEFVKNIEKVSPSINFNQFEYPESLDQVQTALLHQDESICDKIKILMKQLEIKPKNFKNVIEKDHNVNCCKQKYKLDIYMNERDQIKTFNKWIKKVTYSIPSHKIIFKTLVFLMFYKSR